MKYALVLLCFTIMAQSVSISTDQPIVRAIIDTIPQRGSGFTIDTAAADYIIISHAYQEIMIVDSTGTAVFTMNNRDSMYVGDSLKAIKELYKYWHQGYRQIDSMQRVINELIEALKSNNQFIEVRYSQ